eukprot:gb/GECG01006997.1/.p1 GENE.gb/GECG01006997.1/~~gb/GECG01006997.1/.p1  ORF type:complete len:127 (+),score=8.62 gb/GECG01006997.1/:1-381(+)
MPVVVRDDVYDTNAFWIEHIWLFSNMVGDRLRRSSCLTSCRFCSSTSSDAEVGVELGRLSISLCNGATTCNATVVAEGGLCQIQYFLSRNGTGVLSTLVVQCMFQREWMKCMHVCNTLLTVGPVLV